MPLFYHKYVNYVLAHSVNYVITLYRLAPPVASTLSILTTILKEHPSFALHHHPCLFMNALLALRPCKAFGRSFQASLPCLPLPLHQPPSLPQALRTACQALKIIPAFNVFCALQYHTKSNQLIRKNRFCKKATAKAVAQKIIYLKPF